VAEQVAEETVKLQQEMAQLELLTQVVAVVEPTLVSKVVQV
jgi:hypothetical protein